MGGERCGSMGERECGGEQSRGGKSVWMRVVAQFLK
jgi:hypothetical protein